jgi:hypothetical protein
MEPTESEIKSSISERLTALDQYDFSELRQQLKRDPEVGGQTVGRVIAEYKGFWRDFILAPASETPSPSALADIALHHHIILQEDFRQFEDVVLQGQFEHQPVESSNMGRIAMAVSPEKLSAYLSSNFGPFAGDSGRAEAAVDAYILKLCGGVYHKSLSKDVKAVVDVIKRDDLVKTGVLDYDLDYLRRYLTQRGAASEGDSKQAQEMIYSYLRYMVEGRSSNPCVEVRRVWEAHLLHTEDYRGFLARLDWDPIYKPE